MALRQLLLLIGFVLSPFVSAESYIYLTNNTMETLKTSGDLKLIKNHGFKILLSELDKSYGKTDEQGVIFNKYVEGSEWSGFFINNFDMETLIAFNSDPNLSVLFKNKVRHYIKLIESYYFHMQGTLKKIEEVKLALEDEMNRRKLDFNPGVKTEEEEIAEEQTEDSLSNEIDDLLDEIENSTEEELPAPKEETDSEVDDATDDLLEELNSGS